MLENIMTEGECSTLRSPLSQSETIVLCCHQNADGDAVGAVLGMGELLRMLGKEPLMVVPDQYPDYLQWLPNTEKIVRYDKRRDYVDMVLKIADMDRLVDTFCSRNTYYRRTYALLADLDKEVLECVDEGVFPLETMVPYKEEGYALFLFSHFEVDLNEPDERYRTLYVVYEFNGTAS
jgi:hypothetical protein